MFQSAPLYLAEKHGGGRIFNLTFVRHTARNLTVVCDSEFDFQVQLFPTASSIAKFRSLLSAEEAIHNFISEHLNHHKPNLPRRNAAARLFKQDGTFSHYSSSQTIFYELILKVLLKNTE